MQKNYLVIGGSTGIGEAVVKKLSGMGANVFASYHLHAKEPADAVQYFHLDVMAGSYSLDGLPEHLDGLVYCPGNIMLKPFARILPDEFRRDFELQVMGAVRVIQDTLPRLKKSEAASIVLFSTVAVQTGFNFHTAVAVSKGAIEGLTRALAAELAPKIRVNCIAPSITDTPLAASLLNTPEKKEANAQRHPLKRIGTPEDIAAMVSFLLGEEARWITGQVMHVDGGMSALKS